MTPSRRSRFRAGTRLRLETADCFDDQVQAQDDVLDAIDWDRVNPATGPVFVEGVHAAATS